MEKSKKQDVLNDLITKFNMIIVGMVNHITEYYGDSNTICISLVLDELIKNQPDTLISYFLLNIYRNDEYRLNILKQNDEFFIKHNYEKLVGRDNDNVSKIFEFKKLWSKVDIDTKNFIKKSMLALVKLCQTYILAL